MAICSPRAGGPTYGSTRGSRRSWSRFFAKRTREVDEVAIDRLGAQEETIDADRRARRPIVYDKWVNDPIELFFSGHIYPKGATILQMLRHQLGDAAFWKAMNHYTTANAYGTVVTEDLRKAFEESTGGDYKTFFDQWVYGAGFPVFHVSSRYDRSTRKLVINATEVQPRDSLTGFFDVDSDVEVRTDSGVVRFVVPVRNGSGEAATELKAPPRSIRWDKGNWILDITDFPRSTAMMQYQLVNDDDVLGRTEAVDVLAQRPADRLALDALVRSTRNDRFWAVRARAVDAVGVWASDSSRAAIGPMKRVKEALVRATFDPDARVQEEAARALGRLPISGSCRARRCSSPQECRSQRPVNDCSRCRPRFGHSSREGRGHSARQAINGAGGMAERDPSAGAQRAESDRRRGWASCWRSTTPTPRAPPIRHRPTSTRPSPGPNRST